MIVAVVLAHCAAHMALFAMGIRVLAVLAGFRTCVRLPFSAMHTGAFG